MRKLVAAIELVALAISSARAVILLSTGEPSANTTAPGGPLANSGWQFEGTWGDFLGTPIAPHFFISANHIGNAGNSVFTFQNVNYSVVNGFHDPLSDLVIWQVSEAFPTFAPLYTNQDEVGQHLIVIGRGTQRGSARLLDGILLRGWDWGPSDKVQRWGENIVSSIFNNGVEDDLLRAAFDQNGLANECTLSPGDSGGAAFINDGGVWKLAGVSYSVDDPFYTAPSSDSEFHAALFDTSGFYESPDNGMTFTLIIGPPPIPAGFYPTRISTKLAWIYSVIDPTGDLDGDSVSNLLEYALHLDPLTPDAAGLPRVDREGNFLTLTYTKVTTASDIIYTVEQSSDLITWSAANAQSDVISTVGNVQTIKAKIDISNLTKLFLRLRVTRP